MSIIEKAAARAAERKKRVATEAKEAKAASTARKTFAGVEIPDQPVVPPQSQPLDRPQESEASLSPASSEMPSSDTSAILSAAMRSPSSASSTPTAQQQASAELKQTPEPEAATASTINLALDGWREMGGMVPGSNDKSTIAEQFRLIKRPLIVNALNPKVNLRHGNLIMVTSSLEGEGKSFCAINLAMSIAREMDHTVLLVDADMARPAIPKYLGFQADKGLLDVLEGQCSLPDVILRTNIEKLTVLPSGKGRNNSTELLASQSMRHLLEEMSDRYSDRIIIFDTPPLLLATEPSVLALQMGQIVMVVEAESTPQKTVQEALRQIDSCEVVNMLYNKAAPSSGGGYFGNQ